MGSFLCEIFVLGLIKSVYDEALLTLCMLGNFSMRLLSSAHFFKINFFKNSFRNTIRVSNGLDPDQDRQNVGPDLGPKCLQRLSADDKIPC